MRLERVGRWFGRIAARAAAGAGLVFLAGQAARLTFGGCTTLCDPWVSLPLGAISGAIIFGMVGSDER